MPILAYSVPPRRSRARDRDVLERRGIGEPSDQPEGRLADSRAHAVEEAELPDRRVDRLVMDELLHLVEDRRSFLMVGFTGLLRVEFVDVRIVAIGIGAALDDERGKPGC